MPALYLDALAPADPGDYELIDRINRARLRDEGRPVPLGSLDEVLFNLVIEVLESCGKNLLLSMPAGKQDLGIALGIYLQLNRRGQAFMQRRNPDAMAGPVVVLGHNLNLTKRLRNIKMGSHDLSQGIVAGRVRGDGQVTSLTGILSPARVWRHGLLYLNTSLGYPELEQVHPEVAIVDGTTLRRAESIERALDWCSRQNAERILLLTELGSEPLEVVAADPSWRSFPLTPSLIQDVRDSLDESTPGGALSASALTVTRRLAPGIAVYRAPALAVARRNALSAIAAARKIPAPRPRSIQNAVRLVNALCSLWGSPKTADRVAIAQGASFSISTMFRRVEADMGTDQHGVWAAFRETRWTDLRRACLDMAGLIFEKNPRLALLESLIAWAEANRPGAPLRIRTVGRSAALALEHDLHTAGIVLDSLPESSVSHVSIHPQGERLPWATTPALELHLGPPPPWRRASLLAASATEHVVALECDEVSWFMSSLTMLSASWKMDLQEFSEETDLEFPSGAAEVSTRRVFGPISIDSRREREAASQLVELPDFDLAALLAAFTETVRDAVEDPEEADYVRPAVRARKLILEPDARRYYLPLDAKVEVLSGGDYAVVPLSDLTAGMAVLLSRGESRGNLFARLKLAAYSEIDVLAANLLLERFRQAVRELYDQEGSWSKVSRAIQRYGSQVASGAACSNWAKGTSIAPEDVDDIRRVFWAVGRNEMTADGTWQRLGAIAQELRNMHRGLGQVISSAIDEAARGRLGPSCQIIQERCGFDPLEVLEEFQVARVRSIGPSELIQHSQLRLVLQPK
ncbi:DISARM anti-phage system protein DrmE domain-containing protein [Kineosporia babensis]|uniref:DISARM protein DrmE C-terminal domain-containing protein n=1 Tax=Kineosporia babensis TaxID=499548 RepID=A0A9X1N8Z0_9ACTN|nr:hypothetical protein [Kineosporia babensis]MCD5309345.1 hypothetical protein [Kineosporia babensis]